MKPGDLLDEHNFVKGTPPGTLVVAVDGDRVTVVANGEVVELSLRYGSWQRIDQHECRYRTH